MSDVIPEDKIYILLDELSPGSPAKGLQNTDGDSVVDRQTLTDAYITTMYFSALSNLHFQTLLPENMDDIDNEMPRFNIAYGRTYADFTTAKNWLVKNGAEFIETSPAKAYYDEIQTMGFDHIMDIPTAYSSRK
jgi:hypothetical protein